MDLHVVEKGSRANPPVLCIHGLLGSSRNLHRLVTAIADAGFYVIAYDQRGHGHSPHASSYTLEGLAADALAVLDSKNIQAASFVGHSLGARVALAAASLHRERVKRLCMLDAGLKIGGTAKAELLELLDTLPPQFASKEEARALLARHGLMLSQFLLSNLRDDGGVFRWVFDLSGLRAALRATFGADQTAAWAGLTCPALLVRGDDSTFFSKEELALMQKLLPAAQSAIVSKAGHWLHVDNFKDTADAVIKFLRTP